MEGRGIRGIKMPEEKRAEEAGETKEKEKRKGKKGSRTSKGSAVKGLVSLAAGAAGGVLSVWVLGVRQIKGMEFGMFLIVYGLIITSLVLWILVHVVLHEAGHLLCGLLSGYQYRSFRIGSLTFARYPEGMKIKRFSIPGTAGQCLMSPPAYQEGTFSYRLYLSGGFAVNFICALLLFAIFLLLGADSFAGRMLAAGSAAALYLGITNAVPLKADLPNDGYQIYMLGKSREERRAFWESLDFNARLQQGTRVRELEKDWEALDNDALVEQCEGMKGLTGLGMRYNYLLDTERFEEAEDLCTKLLKKGISVELYRKLFLGEALYLELLLHGRKEEIERLATKELLNFLRAAAAVNPSFVRILYAYEKLFHQDAKALEKAEKQFAGVMKNYPVLGELKQETMLVEKVDEVYRQRQENKEMPRCIS